MRKPSGYWTLVKCRKEALKYTKRKHFEEGSSGAFNACRRNNWLDIVCKHMKKHFQINPSIGQLSGVS